MFTASKYGDRPGGVCQNCSLIRGLGPTGLCSDCDSTGLEKHFRQERGMAPQPEPIGQHPCNDCGCPTYSSNRTCHVCDAMLRTVADRSYFVRVQSDWYDEQKCKRALITGRDYFPGA